MSGEPDPTVAGLPFGWGAIFGINLLVGGALVAWIRLRPRMRELEQTAEERLVQRVERLERKLEEERARHEVIESMLRHRLNNADTEIEALLLVLDDDDLPERIKTKMVRIRDLRARHKEAEARERETIQAAKLAAASPSPPTP